MTVEEQLAELRTRWLECKSKGDLKGMKIIELRAKLLKMKMNNTILEAEEIFSKI